MLKDKKKISVSLPIAILSVFTILFLIITGMIVIIQSWNFNLAISYTAKMMMENAANELQVELNKILNPIQLSAAFSAKLIQSGLIKTDIATLSNYTYKLLQSSPLANGSFYADISGTQVYSARQPDNSIIIDIQNRQLKKPIHEVFYFKPDGQLKNHTLSTTMTGDDPRNKPWFLTVAKAKHVIWTDIFRFYDKNQLGIVSAAPVFAYQQFIGSFGLDVTLDQLSDFITKQHVSKNGFTFVMKPDGNLVAYNSKILFQSPHIAPETLINMQNVQLPLITQSYAKYQQTYNMISLSYRNQDYLVLYKPVTNRHLNWIIGVVIPKSDLVGTLQKNNFVVILFCLLLILLGIIIVYYLTSRMMKPINQLSLEAEKMKNFELGDELQIDSRIKEVNTLTNSINSMKRGLHHFQRYVPKILVRQLIESGKDLQLGGEKKDLVILFSDIENFTTISETLDPYQLMIQLCEYFDALTDIIMKESGTIDKYIGDSIMAFWGAPIMSDNPYKRAALAALSCQEKVEELNKTWLQKNQPPFNTRIGIHAGEAIVGNVGSVERLNYTAIGDAINIASRLEGVNKKYATKIIVSDAIYQHIKDEFRLKLIDEIQVKGRAKEICIYELIGIK